MTDIGTSKNNAANEIPSSYSSAGNKLFSMKLFSSWDGEKSTPNCIPRLCTFTITRLVIKKPLETECNSVIIAIKMGGSKRILRSNEIAVQKNGLVDSELDLLFSLQYPHHLKRDGNRLQIMLQRRKKYKHRTILGYKILASGQINMSQVLQHPVDQELNLHSPSKDGKSEAVAKVAIMSLSSQPVDQDDLRGHPGMGKDRYTNYDTWDDEEMQDDGDVSSNDGLSDFEAMDHPTRPRNKSTFSNAFASQQKNLKQKFIKLIRKFKVSDEVLASAVQEIGVHDAHRYTDDYLFDDVESLSDSNPDVDAISLQSVPKPKLKSVAVPTQDTLQVSGSPDPGHTSGQWQSRPYLSSLFSVIWTLTYQHTRFLWSCDIKGMIGRVKGGARGKEDGGIILDFKCVSASHLENGQQLTNDNQPTTMATPSAPPATTLANKKQETKSEKRGEKNISDLFSKKASDKTNSESNSKKEKNVEGTSAGGVGVTGSDKKSSEKQFPALFSGNKKSEKNMSADSSKKNLEVKTANDVSSNFQKKLSSIVAEGGNNVARKVEKPMCYDLKVNESDAFQAKLFQDQITSLTCTDHVLPNCLVFMNYQEPCCLSLKQKMDERKIMSICTSTHADVKTALNALVNRVQKFMNTSSLLIKLVILGGEGYLHSIVRPFVKVISSRSPDIIHHVRFLVVPLGYSFFCQNLAQMDSRASLNLTECDLTEVTDRLMTYMREASTLVQIPFSEVVLTNKEKGNDSSNIAVHCHNFNDCNNHHNCNQPSYTATAGPATTSSSDELELQMDYWMVPKSEGTSGNLSEKAVKKDAKFSLKTAFKFVQIFRPGLASVPQIPQYQQMTHDSPPTNNTVTSNAGLSMVYVTKDKKQKIMRIGKKSRDDAVKSQQIDGISRLICTSKGQSHHLTGWCTDC
ncbi:hypothetical protein HELRODRAFT_167851 [Helobdella robusta]|uniref:Phosphofurin acidic cluster sorting protein 2 n=1 Tax=Helobdella robusta TaxID=6412 RepID=T1EZV7_HELRO|nr:hypothetical protein HELRODRAFT_167851 [Helobdella robusta]ESO10014.1 hypothetical protein HELRODRAFT_167851 [Helobdella robusta]